MLMLFLVHIEWLLAYQLKNKSKKQFIFNEEI